MEVINQKKEDRQMLMILHLSQLLNLITVVGGLIVPILLWQLKKDEIEGMDSQGKEVVNFQLSLLAYSVIAFILAFVLIGFFIFGIIALLNIIFPIIYGLKANNGEPVSYPLTIRFIK